MQHFFSRLRSRLYRLQALIRRQKTIEIQRFENFASAKLRRPVVIDVYIPPGHYTEPARAAYPFVIFNDGQDLETMRLVKTLEHMWALGSIPHVIVVGVHAADRMREYGTAHLADYKKRGDRAASYSRFITQELLPFLRNRYHLSPDPSDAVIAGFSLGGLSALDIAWNHPDLFSVVGVFSGSLWWRSKAYRADDPDADRIMHELIRRGKRRKGLRFWFQTGTHDETSDRNNNGVIDAIDDTLDLIAELEKLGYQQGRDIRYVEVDKGQHNPFTWARALPDFLRWALA